MTSGLSLKLYLNSLVHHRNIFGSSSEAFGNLRKSSDIFGSSRKMFGNVRLALGTILENLRKFSENHQKRRHQYVYIIKRTLHVSSKMRSLVRYCSYHENIKFISSRHRVISSMCFLDCKTAVFFANASDGPYSNERLDRVKKRPGRMVRAA